METKLQKPKSNRTIYKGILKTNTRVQSYVCWRHCGPQYTSSMLYNLNLIHSYCHLLPYFSFTLLCHPFVGLFWVVALKKTQPNNSCQVPSLHPLCALRLLLQRRAAHRSPCSPRATGPWTATSGALSSQLSSWVPGKVSDERSSWEENWDPELMLIWLHSFLIVIMKLENAFYIILSCLIHVEFLWLVICH